MLMRQIVVFSALIFFLAGCGVGESDWEIVTTQGEIHFVVVNASDGLDKGIYRDAMPKVCPNDKSCVALFWKKGDNIPSSVPLSQSDFDKLMAVYAVKTSPRQKNIRWNCTQFPSTTESICLDKNFVDQLVSD